MSVPLWVWLITVLGLLAMVAVDLIVVDGHPRRVTMAEAARWVAGYVALAVVFGGLVYLFAGPSYAGQFFAGYLTEYSLSVDNLFVFLVVMTAFAVPVIHQHRVLLVGILIALVLRAGLILAGAALVTRFNWVFYIFGAFLIYTAYRTAKPGADQDEASDVARVRDSKVLGWLRRVLPLTEDYHGAKSFVRVEGRRMVTPMLVVILAIGGADLMFALDSIPAVFGLTTQSYLVFTINAFALLGLRQLYFLLGNLLRRLVYLPIGLAVLLLFIGVKLILQVLHYDWLPWVPGLQSVPVPVPDTWFSLGVVVVVLVVTVLASAVKSRRDRRQPTPGEK